MKILSYSKYFFVLWVFSISSSQAYIFYEMKGRNSSLEGLKNKTKVVLYNAQLNVSSMEEELLQTFRTSLIVNGEAFHFGHIELKVFYWNCHNIAEEFCMFRCAEREERYRACMEGWDHIQNVMENIQSQFYEQEQDRLKRGLEDTFPDSLMNCRGRLDSCLDKILEKEQHAQNIQATLEKMTEALHAMEEYEKDWKNLTGHIQSRQTDDKEEKVLFQQWISSARQWVEDSSIENPSSFYDLLDQLDQLFVEATENKLDSVLQLVDGVIFLQSLDSVKEFIRSVSQIIDSYALDVSEDRQFVENVMLFRENYLKRMRLDISSMKEGKYLPRMTHSFVLRDERISETEEIDRVKPQKEVHTQTPIPGLDYRIPGYHLP